MSLIYISENNPNRPRHFTGNFLGSHENLTDHDLLQNNPNNSGLFANVELHKVIGHGSFGAVFIATNKKTKEYIAVKRIVQDRRYKNRELQIMITIKNATPHPFITRFIDYALSEDGKYLNLMLEYVPETIFSLIKSYEQNKKYIPLLCVKIYMYQMLRSLAHIHGLGICHRDIKPHNLLVNPTKFELKLCDFGSAKIFVKNEANVAYICSRFYRAPELILGRTDYSTAIDIWSAGCVMAELLIGNPIFPGSSGVDQILEIIKVLGTPTEEDALYIYPNNQHPVNKSIIKQRPWNTIFRASVNEVTINFISKLLCYIPHNRYTALELLCDQYFNEIRDPNFLINNNPVPQSWFVFTKEEIGEHTELLEYLIPPHLSHITPNPISKSTE